MMLIIDKTVPIKTFYTAIVVKPDIFESVIVDERHFKTKLEATQFQMEQALWGNYCYIMPVEV